jgi:phosphonopyruvate decarboxylase
MAIKNIDAVRIVDEHRADGVVITTMNAHNVNFGLPSVTQHEELDFPMGGCMGKASSIGLGLALAQPGRKVLVLDGDGSLLMNLGTLVTISNKAPENLYHFVFENGVYAVTGGQPIPGGGKASFQGLAREAGYAAAYEFEDSEELASEIDRILQEKGPVLITLKIVPEIENTPVQFRQRPRRNTQLAIKELSKALGL